MQIYGWAIKQGPPSAVGDASKLTVQWREEVLVAGVHVGASVKEKPCHHEMACEEFGQTSTSTVNAP